MTQPEPQPGGEHAAALEGLEELLLGGRPSLTRLDVAEQAGVAIEDASHLWHLLGFPHTDDDEVAFTEADVRALKHTKALIDLGILDREREDGLVRTWGRSFARLAEWQVSLLTDVAAELGVDLDQGLAALSEEVLPRVEELQAIVWKRHLMGAWSRVMVNSSGSGAARAVVFVDIVGYTSRSKTMTDRELVAWLEDFESAALDTVLDHDGRIIKNIGDELLLVADTAEQAAAIACELTHRGEDPDDPFPSVRAGVAYGDVVLRLGDVFGPVVNVASRLTSVARPGTVLVDEGTYEQLTGRKHHDDDRDEDDHDAPYRLRRLRRLSVKGYSRLKAWSLKPR